MIRGNVAVVRHGATAPSTQSGAVLLELSPSRMRDSGWDQLPPDVRFAGEPLQKMRAPPWIAIYLNQPLTEKPSCEAEHMAAPERFAKTSDSSCIAGAVHTWHFRDIFRFRWKSGHAADITAMTESGPSGH